jgi:hypothetical protein
VNFTFGEHRFADCRQREVDKHASECPKAAVAARAGVARATVADTPAEPGAAAGSAGAGDCIPGASYRAVAPPMYNYGGQTRTDRKTGRIAYPSARAHAAMYIKEDASHGGSGVMYMFGGFGLDPAAPTEGPRLLADLWQNLAVVGTASHPLVPLVLSCSLWNYEAGGGAGWISRGRDCH